MKLDIETLAREADIWVVLKDVNGPLVYEAEPKHLKAFARLIVGRCADTAKDAALAGWDGVTVSTIIRQLLEDK